MPGTRGTERGRPESWCTGLNQNLQDQLNQGQQLLCVAVQEAAVSAPAKAFGQNMLQNKPQEVVAFESTVERFAGTALEVFEGDIAVLIGDDALFADDAPVEVAQQGVCHKRSSAHHQTRRHAHPDVRFRPIPREAARLATSGNIRAGASDEHTGIPVREDAGVRAGYDPKKRS